MKLHGLKSKIFYFWIAIYYWYFKIEFFSSKRKPKGILKSTSSSTASTGDEASFRMNDSIQSNGEHLPQKKALTFGENEIVEG
jgi:hypothetical protein